MELNKIVKVDRLPARPIAQYQKFTRRQFIRDSLVLMGGAFLSQSNINFPNSPQEVALKPSLEALQIGPLGLFIDPTISQDQQTDIRNKISEGMNIAPRYYPTLNQQGLHDVSFFVYASGQELLNVMPVDSPYRVLQAYELDYALGFGEDAEAYFHITMSSTQDIRFVGEWAHLLQYMLNKNGVLYSTPAWFKEGVAMVTAFDIGYGSLNDWHSITDTASSGAAYSIFNTNPDLSIYNNNDTGWQGTNYAAHALSNMAAEYLGSLSQSGTVDICYQILDQVFNSGVEFYQAVYNFTGLGEQDFYNSFKIWYQSKV